MWLASKHGFYSIVQPSPGEFHVRARLRQDLENLRRLVDTDLHVREWPGADYPFRIVASQREFTAIMAALALDLDYPSFKELIATSPGQRAKLRAFHRIWSILSALHAEG